MSEQPVDPVHPPTVESTTSLATQQDFSFLLPRVIAELGQDAGHAFIDFFTAQIRNPNTRAAYARNVGFFLSWLDEHRVELRSVRSHHVGAYVEMLGRPQDQGGRGLSIASVKQHLASMRRLCDFLVMRQVLRSNPTTEVRGPRQPARGGKTPILNGDEARELFESIDPSTPAGLRDRAFLGAMVYSFARVSAVLAMDIGDYYQVGRSMRLWSTYSGKLFSVCPRVGQCYSPCWS